MNNDLHRVINIIAKIFAGVLIVAIIVGVITSVFGFVNYGKVESKVTYSESMDIENGMSLDIELKATKLSVIKGDEFSYTTNNKSIEFTNHNGEIEIEEKDGANLKNANNEITITLPQDIIWSEISIDNGAGDIVAYNLSADKLEMKLGAGNVKIAQMNVSSFTKIDTGAGNLTIESGKINNLDLDMGMGNAKISAELLGTSSMDCGVGKLDVTVLAPSSDYTVAVSKGLGEVTIDGKKVQDGESIGTGKNLVKISGGVGEIKVSFSNAV